MKFTITSPKPRNPLVALARFRRGGSHQPGGRACRQIAQRDMKRELDQMKRSP